MPLTEAVEINPSVKLKKGQKYAFVEMADLTENVPRVRSSKSRVFSGSGSKFVSGDTLMARITPCLENGKIARWLGNAGEPAFGSTEFIVFRGREGVTTSDYAHYLAVDPHFRSFAISKMTGSSGRQRVPVDALAHYVVGVPSMSVQRSITKILGDLDDKIDLLRTLNGTLDNIVRNLFRAWFVDYLPVRSKAGGAASFPGLAPDLFELIPDHLQPFDTGEAPAGWGVEPLEKLVSQPIRRGLAPRYKKAGGIAVLNQKCVRRWEVNFQVARRHDADAKPLRGSEVARLDILVNSTGVGTLGRAAQIHHLPEPATFDSHLSLVRPDANKISPILLGLNLTEREFEIERLGHGSTGQTELSRHRLGQLRIVVPPKQLQDEFDRFAAPLIAQRTANSQEILTLSVLRDSLLPKLMTGELDAPSASAFGISEKA